MNMPPSILPKIDRYFNAAEQDWLFRNLLSRPEAARRRLARRDMALQQLAAAVASEGTRNAAALAAEAALLRYAATRWRGDGGLNDCPLAYIGTPREHCWRILQAGSGKIPSASRIRRILPQCWPLMRLALANLAADRFAEDRNEIEIESRADVPIA